MIPTAILCSSEKFAFTTMLTKQKLELDGSRVLVLDDSRTPEEFLSSSAEGRLLGNESWSKEFLRIFVRDP